MSFERFGMKFILEIGHSFDSNPLPTFMVILVKQTVLQAGLFFEIYMQSNAVHYEGSKLD